ncbi:phosphonoacetate hydrolase [Spirosomataceae bacterium TFI 002]|nr:phosphonoacetate hydrolase [Spirosomataceae bacterium TFI 002]
MNEKEIISRSGGACELCAKTEDLGVFEVSHAPDESNESFAYLCSTCSDQILDKDQTDPNHWRCLNDSMWSEVPAVQVLAWRMLDRLRGEGWPSDLLDMLYLDDEKLEWAKAGKDKTEEELSNVHKDSNGVELLQGDSVVLIKDLNVKGTSMVAKRGTAVRNISLVHDNVEHIEGKVNGTQIVILTQYTKKSS